MSKPLWYFEEIGTLRCPECGEHYIIRHGVSPMMPQRCVDAWIREVRRKVLEE